MPQGATTESASRQESDRLERREAVPEKPVTPPDKQALALEKLGDWPRPADSVLRPIFSPQARLIESALADGSVRTEQAHPDGTIRSHVRFADGRIQEKISDRYGRPFYVCDLATDGSWTVTEVQYMDRLGRLSPFMSARRVVTSAGSVVEESYATSGRVQHRRQTQANKAS